jgi:rfaE bifunctional protein kinase chain/domain/rfaE bifunctional protein nucleotidyltransferase chain/domain
MTEPGGKVRRLEEMLELREALRREGKALVQCHGCFDIVHPGHIRYLRFAKEQGAHLLVSVSADAVVGKGPGRPFVHEDLRLENLAALEMVDSVVLDDNTWAGPILEALRPDVYVKGKEYERGTDQRFLKEKQIVEAYGGRVLYSSGDVIYSSTFILSQFMDRFHLEDEKVRLFCERHGIDRVSVEALLDRFRDKRVLVLGDAVVDHYVHCDALGIAAETPVLSVTPIREVRYPGAGALICGQIAALGGHATFLTPLGQGASAEELAEMASRQGFDLAMVPDDGREMFTKTRYLVDEQKVFKVDHGRSAPLSTRTTDAVLLEIESRLAESDALVCTDFGYGLFNARITDGVAQLAAAAGRPYYADVSSRRVSVLKFRRPRLATPTEEELRFAFADNESGISNLASRYYRETDAANLILTLGKRGTLIFGRPEADAGRLPTDYLPSLAKGPAHDPVGAGDVFLAAAVLSDLAGAPMAQAAYLASCVAAVHVGTLGNDPVGGVDLVEFLKHRPELAR